MSENVTTTTLWSTNGLSMHVIRFPDGSLGPLMLYCKDRAGYDAIIFCEKKPDQDDPLRYECFRTKHRDPSAGTWPQPTKWDQKIGELVLSVDEENRYVVTFDNLRPEQVLLPSPLPPPINEKFTFNYIAA